MRLPTYLLTSLWLYLRPQSLDLFPASQNDPFLHPNEVLPLDPQIHANLYTYAHLADIAYCISKTSRIEEPFNCDLNCQSRFPNMTLVYQWYFDDTVCGYIATTTDYDESESKSPKKTIVVSLRGTRSFFDSYTDLKVEMVNYSNLRFTLPFCGPDCRVHKGFFEAFVSTLAKVHQILEDEIDRENYELVMVGHSMGGSIALLLGLHFLDLGYDKLTLVTMGQPLVGNKEFVHWADEVLGSSKQLTHNSYERKYLRVIHKDDIVTTIPQSKNLLESYHQFDNQIYLNCSQTDASPAPSEVVDCTTGDNPNCILHDFPEKGLLGGAPTNIGRGNYYRSHNTYFRSMGMCGMFI